MGSSFLYRLRVEGKGINQNLIPIYAFKPGDVKGSPFHSGAVDLSLMEMITLGADGARMLTVCTNKAYAYRSLADKNVDYFELHIKDTRIKTAPTEERRSVATITCRDMKGSHMVPVGANQIKMSCEPLSNELQIVTLSFWGYSGGPVFQRV
jgi:hypothetical protein